MPAPRGPFPGVFVDARRLVSKRPFPGVLLELAWGEKIMLSRVTLEPGGVVPEHSHPHEQAGVCLEGEFELTVDGDSRTVRAGEMYLIPGDVRHSARALEQTAVTLDIFTPVREDYLPDSDSDSPVS